MPALISIDEYTFDSSVNLMLHHALLELPDAPRDVLRDQIAEQLLQYIDAVRASHPEVFS